MTALLLFPIQAYYSTRWTERRLVKWVL